MNRFFPIFFLFAVLLSWPQPQRMNGTPLLPGEIWSAMLVVLGVAAGTRGLEKWGRVKR